MRIAVITSGFAKDEKDTGGAAALHNFVKALSLSQGVDITVFTMYYPVDKSEYDYSGVKVYSFARKNNINKWDKLRIWSALKRKFTEVHKENNFDLIQSLWLGEPGYTAASLSKKHNIPLAAAVCGGELAAIESINYGGRLKYWQNYFIRNTMEQADTVIAGSDFIVNKLKQVYGGKFYFKTNKIPFGADETVFSPGDKKEHTGLNLVNIANCIPVKAHPDLFRAVQIVKEKFPAITLTCCGRDEHNLLPGMVKQHGLENNVILKGFAEHNNIPGILRSSDIFVLSSLHESQNLSMIEAAFCGLPVVSTQVGAAKEITSYLAEPGNFTQLAEKILFVINDYINIKTEAEEKIPALTAKYSVSQCNNRFLELYREIIKT